MLATDNLVFIHLHKSGGTFVNQLLLRHGAGAHQLGYHLPYRELPPQYRDRPVLGTIRDPFGYYVSWYHFQKGMARPNPLFRICSNDGVFSLADTVRTLLWLEADEARLTRLEAEVPEHYQRHGLNLTKRCIRDLRGCGVGFYSYLHRRMFEGAIRPVLLPTNRLRRDLARVLASLGEPVGHDVLTFIREVPDLNTSTHARVEGYFDDALRAELLVRDGTVFHTLRGLEKA